MCCRLLICIPLVVLERVDGTSSLLDVYNCRAELSSACLVTRLGGSLRIFRTLANRAMTRLVDTAPHTGHSSDSGRNDEQGLCVDGASNVRYGTDARLRQGDAEMMAPRLDAGSFVYRQTDLSG